MTSEKKELLDSTFHKFMDIGFGQRNLHLLNEIVAKDVVGFGTAIDERLFGIAQLEELLTRQKQQSAGLEMNWKVNTLNLHISSDENTAVFTNEVTLEVSTDRNPINMYLRFSVVLEFEQHKWVVVHWHGSKPEQVESEKDTWGLDLWKAKADELEKLVADRTAELLEKNRELEIETALEKVRSVAMGMKQAADMLSICQTISTELQKLGVEAIRNIQTAVIYKDKGTYTNYEFYTKHNKHLTTEVSYINHAMSKAFVKKMLEGPNEFFKRSLKGKKVQEWYAFQKKSTNQFADKYLAKASSLNYYWYSLGPIALGISTYEPLSNEEQDLFVRFRNVFELSYRRFLDIEQATAQAREAQIEAALEKVRSRSLAMHKADELLQVATVMRAEMAALGVEELETSSIYTMLDPETAECWYAIKDVRGQNSSLVFDEMTIDLKATQVGREMLKFFNGIATQTSILMKGEQRKEWINYCASRSNVLEGYYGQEIPERTYHLVKFSHGYVGAATPGAISTESWSLLQRMTAVFSMAYTRFLDLQKAEEQAREAQIQLGLERVRARTMAMQKQQDLFEVVNAFGEQLVALGLRVDYVSFINGTISKDRDWDLWGCNPNLKLPADHNFIPYKNTAYFTKTAESVDRYERTGYPIQVKTFNRDEKDEFFDHYFFYAAPVPQEFKQFLYEAPGSTIVDAFLSEVTVSLCRYDLDPFTQEQLEIFKRFSVEFRQAYIRFLDLQKAEAQAREAQIEAALERVRRKAMAMHNSSDLPSTAIIAFSELKKLGFVPIRGGISIQNKENRKNLLYSATSSDKADNLSVVGWATLDNHPILSEIYNQWLLGNDYYPSMKGKVLQAYYKQIQPTFNIPLQFPDEEQFGYFMHFTHGTFYGWCKQAVTEEEKKLLKRFATVVDLTFKRFFDLQKAEAQAREAEIQLALERVRAKTMAMQSSEELADAAYVLFEQLKALGVTHERINIGIVNEDSQTIDFWITEQGGDKLNTKFSGRISEPTTLSKAYTAWKNGEKSLMIDLQGDALKSWLSYLNDEINIPFNKAYLHDRRVQTAGFFSKGMLIVTSPEPLQQETLYLLEKFAGVFDLTYTRFSDLKLAEAQALQAEKDLIEIKIARQKAEEALAELKSTQAQLIQQEKLASLGQLTAGIAHEIKNPLNFVNNFSEVNSELISELIDEVDKGNIAEVKFIAADIKENSEKINHHGKRADAIVKGMLQHSRSGSGKKEPTDINTLADEYLRLAYHGIKAKNKQFNASFKFIPDQNLPLISVVPQDIGRVLLNLINNAFYAVYERSKLNEPGYFPQVTLTTLSAEKAITIVVHDNGNGIPEEIKEKIFQPFFTTKPTGEGTGLGLSLSYDIVNKGHQGQIDFETKEKVGTTFTVKIPIV